MQLDAAWLDGSLKRMPQRHTVRGFVFRAVLECVARRAGAETSSLIRDRWMRRKPNDLLSYPAHDFFRMLSAGATALDEPLGEAEALRILGHASGAGFFASPMGKLLLGIVGRGDPARLMANEPSAYATSFSFGQRSFERKGERELHLTHRDDYLPMSFNVGALHSALEAITASAAVTAEPLGEDAARYVLTWR